jgi:hypothetical protein
MGKDAGPVKLDGSGSSRSFEKRLLYERAEPAAVQRHIRFSEWSVHRSGMNETHLRESRTACAHFPNRSA